MTAEVVKSWVTVEEWEGVKRAIKEGLEWDEGIWREMEKNSEMKQWGEENWKKF